jgi:hypothetical protein
MRKILNQKLVNGNVNGGEQDGCAQRKGSMDGKCMEDVVNQLEQLCEDMTVVKAYIVALQKPLLDRCNTWIDGRMVAKILRINAQMLKTLREQGTIPYSRIGGKFYYQVEDLEEMLRKNYSRGKGLGGVKNIGGGDE